MRQIVICNTSIEPGDAVTNDILGMQRVLQDHGYAVSICVGSSALTDVETRPLDTVSTLCRYADDILIYHYATGWDRGFHLLKTLPGRKIVKYHNVTPPHFFEGIDQGYVDVCRAGREQLQDIAQIESISAFWACSDYSLQDFQAVGIRSDKCGVLPPFHHIDRLFALDADLKTLDKYNDTAVSILAVGRLAPNKGHDALIDVFATYHHAYNRKSRLIIVGGQDPKLSRYTVRLKTQVRQLGLEGSVVFTGKVSDAELKAFYLIADVFMTTSWHEGFCVPLIEAMAMKIPIVAYATSAIAETVGETGITWKERDPGLLAASIDAIVKDGSVRRALGEMGARRYREQFSNARTGEDFVAALERVL